MGFEGIENLRILKEAEDIADEIWDEVIKWDYFVYPVKYRNKITIQVELIKYFTGQGIP